MFIDTHTHLYVSEFDKDRDEVMKRAIEAGVGQFVLPAIDSHHTKAMHALCEQYPDRVSMMMGLHPTHVGENHVDELAHVEAQLKSGKYVAVGEIGIDLYWDTTKLALQQQAFHQQIQWALEYDLPIVIHCRDAFKEVFEVLDAYKSDRLRGIFHCFTGTEEDAHRAISHNMLLGIGGVVTFKNGKIDQYLSNIPLEKIVLETDAPYLAPVPYRGKRNESAYLPLIAQKVADLYGVSLEAIAAQTTANARKLFQ